MFVTVWEFHVRAGKEAEFERVYGSEGDWARLFRRGEGHIRTDLHRDLNTARRYLVLDHWTSRETYEAFRTEFAQDYKELDVVCEGLTEKETPLGYFGEVSPEGA